jgi:hypothetical protein
MKIKLAIAGALLSGLSVWGHHSFAAEYDGNKPVTLKGTVIKMDWVNPHSWLHIKVTDSDGKEAEWLCETAPPNGLYRQGWRKTSLKEGDQVTVEGFRAKDASNTMTARSVITADGRRMFAGTASDGAPGNPKQ